MENDRLTQYIGGAYPTVVNYELGNYYIKDLDTDTILQSGTAKENWSTPYNVFIGWRYSNSGTKYYYMKIYDNGNLIRDYIPVYNQKNNLYGFYDLENGLFYGHENFTGYNI